MEQVFEGRFATAKALAQMGAAVETEGQRAVIKGSYPLKGAAYASDLRAGQPWQWRPWQQRGNPYQ